MRVRAYEFECPAGAKVVVVVVVPSVSAAYLPSVSAAYLPYVSADYLPYVSADYLPSMSADYLPSDPTEIQSHRDSVFTLPKTKYFNTYTSPGVGSPLVLGNYQ